MQMKLRNWKKWLSFFRRAKAKKEPGKLPARPQFITAADSREAAGNMIRRIFRRR